MNPNNVDQIYQAFANHGPAIQAALFQVALELFGGLFVIELVLSVGRAVAQKTDILDIILLITNHLITAGFYMFLMQNWATYAKAITDSFAQAGGIASQAIGGVDNMMPVGMIMAAANIAKHIWSAITTLAWYQIALALLLSINGIVVILTLGLFAALMIEILIECYFASYIGIVMMGFGANTYTRDMAIAQIRYSISVGVKRMTMQLIAGVSAAIVDGWATTVQNNPDSIGWLDMAIMLIMPVIILRLAYTQPKIAQDVIMGTHLQGSGNLVTTAAAVARAATVAATAVTGAAAAIGAGAAVASRQMGVRIAAGTAPSSRVGQAAVMSRMAVGATSRALAADVGRRLTGQYSGTHGYRGFRVANDLMQQRDKI
jgi:type IV secretion system protein TrbL